MADDTSWRVLAAWLRDGVLPRPADAAAAGPLAERAEREGVLGLLAGAVAERPEAWPASQRAQLAARQRELLVRGLRLVDQAARLLEALGAAGVRALPLKGAILASEVYRVASERPMDDIDLLALDDWPAAVAVLGARGLVVDDRADHAWRFREPETRLAVELHHSLTSCPGFYPLDAEGLWQRALPGRSLPRVPAPEDLLVQLALHAAFQHGLQVALIHLLDFRRLLEARSLDPATVLARAREARAEPALWACLRRAVQVVGARPPSGLVADLEPFVPRATRRWLEGLPGDGARLAEGRSLARARWALAAGRRAGWVSRTLMPPGPGSPRGAVKRVAAGARRAAGLVRRWGFRS